MWPSKIARGQARNFNLGTLHFAFEADKHPDTHAMHMPGQSWVLGYAIPPFQRPRVWTVEQSIKFVESCILGLDSGCQCGRRVRLQSGARRRVRAALLVGEPGG